MTTKTRIIFLSPPATEYDAPMPPLNFAYLSAYLKHHHHQTKIIDLWLNSLDNNELKHIISDYRPDAIALSFFSRRYYETKKLLQKLKKWFPFIPLIVGGPHASALPEQTMEQIKEIDFIVYGEGEETILELMNALSTKKFEEIHGIVYRNGQHAIKNKPRALIKNLDSLPYLDLEGIQTTQYLNHPPYGWFGLPLTMVTTRGCPGKCIYCCKSVFGHSLRSLTPRRVINEIKYWKEKLPIKEIRFYDDDFTITKKRTMEICNLMISEKINLPWICTTRVDFLSRDLLVKMKEAGLYFLALGVESGSPKVLEALKKHYTVDHIKNAFKWCRELDIYTFGYFLVGGPGEGPADIKMSYQLQAEIRPNFVIWGALRKMPGSPFFENRDIHINNPDDPGPYREIYRKDIPEDVWQKYVRIGMKKHYFSIHAIKSIMTYFYKTKNLKAIMNYCKLLYKGRL